MHLVYLEAGSGSKKPVSTEMVSMVRSYLDIPLIVGGGIRTSADAGAIVEAGADIVVTGNLLEEDNVVGESIDGILSGIREAGKRRIKRE